jgi:N-acetylneuraminic acid mutarotase
MKRTLLLIFSALSVSGFAQWTFKAPMAVNTGQEGVVAHPNGNIYVFGGFALGPAYNTLYIYNEATDTWTTGANLPAVTRGPSYCLGPDSCIYCFGGFDPGELNAVYKYNPTTNTWTTLAAMPNACWYSAAAKAPNGKIYVMGGESADAMVQVYDPALNTWSTGANIPVPVKEHAAVCAPDGKIYVIGGLSGSAINNVQIYDPVANSWSTGAPMPTPRNEFAYVLAWDGRIYCIGGKTSGGNNSTPFYTVVEIYDPAANSWTTGPILPKGLGETAGAGINYGINVFAGADSTGQYSKWNLRLTLSATGTEENALEGSFIAYPNPATDKLTLGFGPALDYEGSITITDLTGKVVYTHECANLGAEQGTVIDVHALDRGFYVLTCVTAHGTLSRKIVLN